MRRPPQVPALRPRAVLGRSRRAGPPPGPRPDLRLTVTEPARAGLDLAALALVAPALVAGHRGDGHPVLVLPGLVGGDASTLPLRRYLGWLGHDVHASGTGPGGAPTQALVSGLRERLQELAARGGRVSVVGWSLGGVYAHELARRSPGLVRQVVTLGSPVRLPRSATRGASRLLDHVSWLHPAPALLARPWTEAGPLRVPATSVYTRGDGVVPWQACLLRPGRQRQDVEVRGSHLGLAVNPAVLHVLADRLGQPAGSWRPFTPGPLTRHLYP